MLAWHRSDPSVELAKIIGRLPNYLPIWCVCTMRNRCKRKKLYSTSNLFIYPTKTDSFGLEGVINHKRIRLRFKSLKEAKFKCNVYTSPHIKKINERFVFNNKELNDDELSELFEEVEKINDNNSITFYEILTACYLFKAAQYPKNINLVESGLFFRFDASNVFTTNLASIITAIGKDHLDWLPKDEQTIEKIVFEKTSSLLNSNIIISKQNTKKTMDCIKKNISQNKSKKIIIFKQPVVLSSEAKI